MSLESVWLETSNLLNMEYIDHIVGQYPVLNLDSLIEAKIWLEKISENEEEEVIVGDYVTTFVIGVTIIQKIYLSKNTILVCNFLTAWELLVCQGFETSFVWQHNTLCIGSKKLSKILSHQINSVEVNC